MPRRILSCMHRHTKIAFFRGMSLRYGSKKKAKGAVPVSHPYLQIKVKNTYSRRSPSEAFPKGLRSLSLRNTYSRPARRPFSLLETRTLALSSRYLYISPCLETPSFSRPWPGRSGNMWNSLRIYHISPSDNTSSGVYVAQPIFDDCPCFVLIISLI